MTRDFLDYLDDMLEFAKKARAFVGEMGWEQFAGDERTQFAAAATAQVSGRPPQGRSSTPLASCQAASLRRSRPTAT